MSKPPHKIELPSLDDLFDDTFERNARRVLSAAERLEERMSAAAHGETGTAQAERGEQAEEQRPKGAAKTALPENQQNAAQSLTTMFGSLLMGIGIIAAAFALTLFILNSYSGRAALAAYVWPIGLGGQMLILVGFWLRTVSRGWASRPNSGNSGNATRDGDSPFTPNRWDQGHALPPLPERSKHGTRASQR